MPNKKSFKSDLERRRFIFFAIGCIVALSLSWVTLDLLATTEKVKAVVNDDPETATVNEFIPPETDIKPVEENKQEIMKDNTEILFKIVDNTKKQTFEGFFPQDFDPDMAIEEWDGPEVVETEPETEAPFVFVEKMPEFPGGAKALNEYLNNNLVYPTPAKEAGAQGTVLVEFVVEKDGSVSNATVKVGQFPALDEEALRVVRSLPKWKPGEANGRKVRVYYNIPINFSLQ